MDVDKNFGIKDGPSYLLSPYFRNNIKLENPDF